MPFHTLQRLEQFFINHTELQGIRYITVIEKIAIFMHVVGHSGSNHDIQECYQHSGLIISLCFKEVLKACLYLHIKYINLLSIPHWLDAKISQNCKYTLYFDDSLGALDSMHIPIHILKYEYYPYRNQKKWLSQNVLAACNFDIQF